MKCQVIPVSHINADDALAVRRLVLRYEPVRRVVHHTDESVTLIGDNWSVKMAGHEFVRVRRDTPLQAVV